MKGYTNVCYFSDGRAKAVLTEGLVPVTDDGDQVLSQMVTVTVGSQPELILWTDDILSVATVLRDALKRAVERRDQFDAEVSPAMV